MPLPIILAALKAAGAAVAPAATTKLFFDTIEEGPKAIAKAALFSPIPGNELLDVGEVIHDLASGNSGSSHQESCAVESPAYENNHRGLSASGRVSSGSHGGFSAGGRGGFRSGGRG